MEYVEGESLRALLEREGKLDPARGVELAGRSGPVSPKRIGRRSCIAISRPRTS
jgi:hypothetical protein